MAASNIRLRHLQIHHSRGLVALDAQREQQQHVSAYSPDGSAPLREWHKRFESLTSWTGTLSLALTRSVRSARVLRPMPAVKGVEDAPSRPGIDLALYRHVNDGKPGYDERKHAADYQVELFWHRTDATGNCGSKSGTTACKSAEIYRASLGELY